MPFYLGSEKMKDKTVRLSGIIHESLTNGPGMRRVIFAQGCKHNCKSCFNKDTHDFNSGVEFKVDDIVRDIKANPLLKGITFSGGDPLEQGEGFSEIAKQVRNKSFNVWCYTGYTFEEILKGAENNSQWRELINNIDVLVDGKFIEELKDDELKFRGSKNQRIIDVPNSLRENKLIEVAIKE